MATFQNWNNLLYYIKSNIGEDINLLELSDDEIISYIMEHSLQEYSSHVPHQIWAFLVEERDRINPEYNYSDKTYRIPIDEEKFKIITVKDAYYSTVMVGTELYGYSGYTYMDPRDAAMTNTFSDMLGKTTPTQSYNFIPPNIIRFDLDIRGAGIILKLNVTHNSLETIPHDSYNHYFKRVALRDTISLIMARRSKFQNLQSPFGEIRLNIDFLRDLKQRLDDKIREIEEWDPPEDLIDFIV